MKTLTAKSTDLNGDFENRITISGELTLTDNERRWDFMQAGNYCPVFFGVQGGEIAVGVCLTGNKGADYEAITFKGEVHDPNYNKFAFYLANKTGAKLTTIERVTPENWETIEEIFRY